MASDRVTRFVRRLGADERGFVLPMVALTTVAFFGVGGLVIDLGRVYNANTELQSYADAAALAAAAELDAEPGARQRAIDAATNLIADTQTFGTGGADLTIDRFRFFSEIPDDDAGAATPTRGPILPDPYVDEILLPLNDPAGDADAGFVEVTVRQETLNLFFMPVLQVFGIGAPTQATTRAWATASFNRAVCNIPPLMICNPWEQEGGEFAVHAENHIGQQIRSKFQGNGAGWAPGTFGLLRVPGATGAADLRNVMAAVDPGFMTPCYDATVDVEPGQDVGPVRQGVNTRFDMYEGAMQPGSWNRPAQNVTKGKVPQGGAACPAQWNPAPLPPATNATMALPRDTAFTNGRFGNSTTGNPSWSTCGAGNYWEVNHPGVPCPGEFATRYDLYRYEIANGLIPNKSMLSPKGENGNPQCNANPVTDPLRDRRILYVAVVNCIAAEAAGQLGGAAEDVPTTSYIKVFLTEPVTDPPDNEIFVEMLDIIDAGADDGILHEYPTLVR